MKLILGVLLILLIIITGKAYTQSVSRVDSLINLLETKCTDSLRVAELCLKIGQTFNHDGDFDQSLIYLTRALKIGEMKGEKTIQKAALDKLTIVYTFQGNYPVAIHAIQRAIALAEEAGDDNGVNKSKLNLGIIYKHQGDYTDALDVFLKALPYFEHTGDKRVMNSLDNCIGTIYYHLDVYPEALLYLNKALEFSREEGLQADIASNLLYIAKVCLKQKKFEDAMKYQMQVLDIYTKSGDRSGIGGAWIAVGDIYAAEGNTDKAMESYVKALKISGDCGDHYNRAICLKAIGDIHLDLARRGAGNEPQMGYTKAEESYRESLKLAAMMDNKDQLMQIYKSLYEIDSTRRNYQGALENYKNYSLYRDSIYNDESKNKYARLQFQFMREQKDREIDLLTRDNEIIRLQLLNQKAALRESALQTERDQASILFLDKSRELQALQLDKTTRNLHNQESEFRKKEAELILARQIRELQEQEIHRQKMQRNGVLFTTGLVILVGFLMIRSGRLKKRLEKQEAVARERERISADLHDDIGSGLSKIILMLEVMTIDADIRKIKDNARVISEESINLSKNISEVIWALNSKNDTLESLVAYIRKYAGGYFEHSDIEFRMSAPVSIPLTYLSGEQRRNIFYVVKEALHNIVKHADAGEAEVRIVFENSTLELIIRDNGVGISEGKFNRFGNGLNQMRKRIQSIGGEFTIERTAGTMLRFCVPV